jgi:hypothetical protein
MSLPDEVRELADRILGRLFLFLLKVWPQQAL